jgi:zinc/manganese transport system permease protein
MSELATWWSIVWPALAAGVLVTLTHVPLGIQVLERGIVFIDLAIAQIAGLGVIAADWAGLEPLGWQAQSCALSAALAGALLLTWTDRRWPSIQEAIIGVSFVLAASGALLLLAANPHGGEHLKDLLVGQILWVAPSALLAVALAYGVSLAVWFGLGTRMGRTGFYVLFACAVTISVQVVGLYLVFATLIVPALATRGIRRARIAVGYLVALLGYAVGLVVATITDLPAGPAIVWLMVMLAILLRCASLRRISERQNKRYKAKR